DPFLRSAAVTALARPAFRDRVEAALADDRADVRLGALLALRRADAGPDPEALTRLLADPSEPVRMMALIRAGEGAPGLPPDALRAAVGVGDGSARLVEVYLATLAMLRGDELQARRDRVPGFQIRRAPGHELVVE